jgi:hypothetical protein
MSAAPNLLDAYLRAILKCDPNATATRLVRHIQTTATATSESMIREDDARRIVVRAARGDLFQFLHTLYAHVPPPLESKTKSSVGVSTATTTGRNAEKRKRVESNDDSSQRSVRQKNDDAVAAELTGQIDRFQAPSFTRMIGGPDVLAVMRSYLTQREDALVRTVSDEFSDGYVYQASSVTLNMSDASRESSLDTLKVLVHRYPGLRCLRIEELDRKSVV